MSSRERLQLAVDAVVREVLAIVPPDTDVTALHRALGDVLAETLNAASVQSAEAVVAFWEVLDGRLKQLEERERGT